MGWNEVRKDEEGGSGGSSEVEFMKFPEGNSEIRIVDDEPVSKWKHWMPQHKRSVICPGKGCPICNIIKNARENKDKPPYNSSKRYHIHVIDRKDNSLKIMENSKTFFGQLLTLRDNVGNLTDYDLKVIRKGLDMHTTYNVIPMAKDELTKEDEALLEQRVDLEEFFSAPTSEQIIELLDGKTFEEVFNSGDEEEIEVDFSE